MSLVLDQGGAESDIVERLRDQARRLCDPIDYPVERTAEWEAATAIASLREERDELKKSAEIADYVFGRMLADNASLRERVRVLEGALTTIEGRCDYIIENELPSTWEHLADISSLAHNAVNEQSLVTKPEAKL